jgi:hypothetical protein
MVVELILAGSLMTFGAITSLGTLIARARMRAFVESSEAPSSPTPRTSPFRSPAQRPAETRSEVHARRFRVRSGARNTDLMIGRTFYR